MAHLADCVTVNHPPVERCRGQKGGEWKIAGVDMGHPNLVLVITSHLFNPSQHLLRIRLIKFGGIMLFEEESRVSGMV